MAPGAVSRFARAQTQQLPIPRASASPIYWTRPAKCNNRSARRPRKSAVKRRAHPIQSLSQGGCPTRCALSRTIRSVPLHIILHRAAIKPMDTLVMHADINVLPAGTNVLLAGTKLLSNTMGTQPLSSTVGAMVMRLNTLIRRLSLHRSLPVASRCRLVVRRSTQATQAPRLTPTTSRLRASQRCRIQLKL